ncbi:sulfotransferase family 2 domain-containing protein [Maritimibacter dapengensis]|uniref:Sulfotransferase family protein n=1 Tax=Maritimibacter dapengensis TaxID=2836868 RepID=A0ABS6T3I8_9RHOB|nr:sulfotransferase family protein [Maritimibacter dapengensis]
MPFFRADSKLIFFAHVPKCAGSSMFKYLEERFGSVAFYDGRMHFLPEQERWSRSSPQHIDVATFERIFPKNFFDATFAFVRHPVSRMVSAYHFQQDIERSVPPDVTLLEWLDSITEARKADPFVFDNHVRPMSEIVPGDAKVFRLEEGTAPFIDWLDELTGNNGGPRELPKVNEQGSRKNGKKPKTKPTDEEIEKIMDIYQMDFDRFGYSADVSELKKPHTPNHSKSSTTTNSLRKFLRSFGGS